MKTFSWRRRDLVRTYGLNPETVMMMTNDDILNIFYKITEGF